MKDFLGGIGNILVMVLVMFLAFAFGPDAAHEFWPNMPAWVIYASTTMFGGTVIWILISNLRHGRGKR